MGKKKKTTHPFWSNIAKMPTPPQANNANQPTTPQANNANKRPTQRVNLIELYKGCNKTKNQKFNPTKVKNWFQQPHHQQNSVIELTDDTSPNNPMNKGNNSGNSDQGPSQQRDLASEPIFELSDEVQKEEDFCEDVEVGNTFYIEKEPLAPQPQMNAETPKGATQTVQGTASSIKLVMQGTKSVTVALSTSTSTETTEKPKLKILASETITSKFSAPTSTKEIDTRVTRDLNPKPQPQQYIAIPPLHTNASTSQQEALSNAAPAQQTPKQPYNIEIPQNMALSLPMATTPGSKNSKSRIPRSFLTLNASYPAGIPKSFLQNRTPQTPEPYKYQHPHTTPTAPDPNQQWGRPQRPPAPNVIEYAYNYNPKTNQGYHESGPLYVNTDVENKPLEKQAYSPSDVYADSILGTSMENDDGVEVSDGSESPVLCEAGEKRLSAFKRLGPLTQPKKPKLTINLMCNKDQSVREVVNETEPEVEDKYIPVHLRPEITTSTDDTVMKYLMFWPWRKPVTNTKTVTARNSKSVMILEQEQMVEIYDKNSAWIQVLVKGYPPTWTKNKLLDTLLDTVNGKPFIPCFIEFAPDQCKFLVIRSRPALLVFHKIGFIIHKEGHELQIFISCTELTLNQIEFIPKLILKKRLVSGYSGERSLDLSEFTMKEDVSHFIYFPLNRLNNQIDVIEIQSSVAWQYLTDLNLSYNRLSTIEGFNLASTTPKLKFLDLSYNCLEKATLLLRCRNLSLRTLKLEGNPLCTDYTDPSHYVKVLKLMFPTLVKIDGIPIKLPGDMPIFNKSYCPETATQLIEKFLEIYFPLLESTDENRDQIRDLYHARACLTITTRYKLRYGTIFKPFRTLFERARVPDEGSLDSIDGAKDISKLIAKWPPLKHDPFTFTVDVLLHEDYLTIFKIGGLARLTAETLAEDEHLLAFTRTVVLHSQDGTEYKITNEMLYWDEPTEEYAHTAFQMTVKPNRLSLKLESPDEELKKKLVEIFMKLTDANETVSEKCLEQKEWNLKYALEYFMKLLKLDDLESLTKEIKV